MKQIRANTDKSSDWAMTVLMGGTNSQDDPEIEVDKKSEAKIGRQTDTQRTRKD